MTAYKRKGTALLDGSRLIAESFARAGAHAYIGYPITPASLIYGYASRRLQATLPAPDEITALQWMAGLSTTGKLAVSATSFPGMALMVESINMAVMMELPMVIVLVQRLGPSTGTATAGAQGDLRFTRGIISGGYPIPIFCISDIDDCWRLPPVALQTAVDLRTPVVLLTSKEMVMTQRSFDLNRLGDIQPVERRFYDAATPYHAYRAGDAEAPAFLPIGDDRHQVRITASTHNEDGLLKHSTDEAMDNTRRLSEKVKVGTPALYHLEEPEGAGDNAHLQALVVTYGITSGAAREAVHVLDREGTTVSLLIAKTLVPVPDAYYKILDRYLGAKGRGASPQSRRSPVRVVFAEENLQGQLASIMFGERCPEGVHVVGHIGHMISPDDIVREVGR